MAETGTTQRGRRLLGVFAHPDDETFCAGGTFAKYTALGAEAMVVSFTKGDAGQIRDAGAATRRTLGEVRERELRAACESIDIQTVECRDYKDGELADADPNELVREIVGLIRMFRPDVVFTFGEEGAYGHPDHIAISVATTEACRISGDPEQFPEQIGQGVAPHRPDRLYHSHFPRNRLLLTEHLSSWLSGLDTRFRGSSDFVQGLTLFASESTTMGFNSDHVKVGWFPPGFYIIEQGEPATSLYLILSGKAEVYQEDADGVVEKVAERGPGEFVGEAGLAYGKPRNASIVASDSVTCLVFSPAEPTAFAGRGEDAQHATSDADIDPDPMGTAPTTCIDVTDYVTQKMQAISAHRTQYRVTPDMFPDNTLKEMLGREYFVRVDPAAQMETEL